MKKYPFLKCAGLPDDGRFICADAETDDALIKELTRVDGIAYSGGPVAQWWAREKLIIDLSGMETTPQTVLLYNHYNDPEYRLGEINVAIDGKTIQVAGGIDTGSERGRMIAESGKKFNWQLSIGAEILEIEQVSSEGEREINGRNFKGPFLHVKKSILREVSVCAVGADPETSLRIAASLNIAKTKPVTLKNKENNIMKAELKKFIQLKYKLGEVDEAAIKAHLAEIGSSVEEEEACFKASRFVADDVASSAPAPEPAPESAPAPVNANAAGITAEQVAAIVDAQLRRREAAEGERRAGIVAACGEDYAAFAQQAITAGYSVQETTRIVAALKAQAAALPKPSGPNILIANGQPLTAQVLEAALCFNQGINESTIAAEYPESVVEAGNKMRGITLRALIERCAMIEGKSISAAFDNATIAAAFSTVSLPGILSNVANKKLLQAFNAQPIIATALCKAGDLNDFKESERYRLTDVGDLEIVAPGGEIKHGGLAEDKATNKLETYGKMFTLTRQMIYNDDLSAFTAIPAAMGLRAARKIDQLFHARLLSNPKFSDGNNLFCNEHGNYTAGSAGALSLESLKAARSKFLLAKDSDGQPINVLPKFLFVPSCLDSLANELIISPTVVGGQNVSPAFNVVSKFGLQVVSSPYLQIGVGGQPGSSTGWYLFGDPAQIDTFEIGYLAGRRTPTVEQSDVDFNTLGINFRVVFDLGVREQAWQGMTYNTGVAA